MTKLSTMRRAAALPVIASCRDCHWFDRCGGYHDTKGLFGDSCFARHCCGGKDGCNYLCPPNPRFVEMMNELDGLEFDDLPELVQPQLRLPVYAPSVANNSCRTRPLAVPFAAVPVEAAFRACGDRLQAIARTAPEFRAKMGLAPGTRIVLNCIRQDNELERLWEFWLQDDLPAQLAPLDIDAVIAPNFSHLRGVPRLESVGNRMRHLMCARDLAAAGLATVPHLSVVDPPDWTWWREYLIRNRRVRYVSFEFETGYRDRVEGIDAIGRLACIQRDIERPLHLVVVGGSQYWEEVRAGFAAYTFIDSRPFMSTVYRDRYRVAGGQLAWTHTPTPTGAPLDELLEHNVRVYREWFAARLRGAG